MFLMSAGAGRHLGQARQQPAVAHVSLLHVQIGRAVGAEERAADRAVGGSPRRDGSPSTLVWNVVTLW